MAIPLDECLAQYIAHLAVRAKPRSLSFAQTEQNHLLRLLNPSLNVSRLDAGVLDAFIAARRAEGVGDATINSALRVLRAAIRLRLGAAAPRVKLLKEGKRIPTALTLEAVDALVAASEDERTALAILLAAHAGLRHQEVLHLTWADVRDNELRVAPKAGWSPKNHHERAVPLSYRLGTALIIARPAGAKPEAWVIQGQGERRLQSLHRQVKAAFVRAKLWDKQTKPGLHMLRRTFASRLLESGVDLETVKELGGWSSITVVERYLSSTTETKRRAIADTFR